MICGQANWSYLLDALIRVSSLLWPGEEEDEPLLWNERLSAVYYLMLFNDAQPF
jgi:hypothetical protein